MAYTMRRSPTESMDGENVVENFSHRALLIAAEVEAKAEEIHTLVNEFREDRRAACDAVSRDIASEIKAAEHVLQAAEVGLREAGERLDRLAKGVVAGNRDARREALDLPDARMEVLNLLQLDRYPEHKKALEVWEQRVTELSTRISLRETQSADISNGIFLLFWGHAVFLAVVLTAVSQLTETSNDNPVPVCGKVWFPIVLTVFGTILAIAVVIYKLRNLKSLELAIRDDNGIRSELYRRISSLRFKGPQWFDFETDVRDLLPIRPKSFWKDKILVIMGQIVFSVFFILSYFVILCDTGTIRDWDKGLRR